MDLNVSLTDDLVSFIEAKVASGRYASSNEVVREALRLMEAQDRRQFEDAGWLRRAWQDGMDSGDFQPLDLEAIKAEGRRRISGKSA